MTRTRKDRRRRAGGRGRSKALLALAVLAIVAGLTGLSAVGYVVSVAASAPSLSVLKPRDLGGASRVFAADNQPLGFIQADAFRQTVTDDRIPEVMKQATIAIEDERFYRHTGVDFTGVVRAAVANFSSRKTVQGGSTITMQLVRSLYISNERTFQRKIREAKLAEELEDERSKQWILDAYLNSVSFGTVGGQTAIGVQAAARMYFDKPASELKLHEAAMIAGLPQAPHSYSPVRAPEAALQRRNEVLAKMAELEIVTSDEARTAMNRKLGLNQSSYFTKRRERYFFDYVKDELIREYGLQTVRQGGLRVYTTIDLDKQRAAREAIAARLEGVGPSSAIVTLDARDGEIEAMASAGDYSASVFNLAAQGKRQPGSTFKIMGLMAAVRKGVNPESTSYVSKPLNFVDPTYGPIEVKTYDDTYGGSKNLVRATTTSDNSVYQQLALDLGPDEVKRAARDMGIRATLKGYPGEVLGGLTYGVSPLEMATAYATIANGGYRVRPTAIRKVVFPDGKSERPPRFAPKRTKAFEPWMTYEVTKILQRNMTEGTGTSAQIGCPAAGKTGTTDEHGDAWFVGYTPKLATAVWVGYPEARIPMLTEYHGARVAGGTYPAEIWGDYMEQAKGKACGDFPVPDMPPQWVPFAGKYAGSGGAGTGEDFGTGIEPAAPAPPAAPQTEASEPDYDDNVAGDQEGERDPDPAPAPEEGGGTDGGGGGVNPGDYQSPAGATGGGAAAPGGT